MPKLEIMSHARFLLVTILLFSFTEGRSVAEDECWNVSPINICAAPQICIEWDFDQYSIVTECCEHPIIDETVLCDFGCIIPATDRDDNFILVDISPESSPLANEVSAKATDVPKHTVPRIPLTIDHVPYPPEDVTQFNGQALHFLMCRSSIEQSKIFSFTTLQGLYDQLHDCSIGKASFPVPEAPSKATGGIAFYDGRWWTGASYFLPSGQSLELNATWWNQRISSLRGVGRGTFLTLFENVDRSGSTLTLTSDLGWQDLGALGWNNRAASLVVWPAPTKPAKPLDPPVKSLP